MKITVFGSGSKGNCSLVEFQNGSRIFLDCGVNPKKITVPKANSVWAVTHSHADHAKYAKQIKNDYNGTIITSKCTKEEIGVGDTILYPQKNILFDNNQIKMVANEAKGGFHGFAIATHHDAEGSCAFVFFTKEETMLYCMDTGIIPDLNGIKFDCIFIEANYTQDRITESKQDEQTKIVANRVDTPVGHLSLEAVYDHWLTYGKGSETYYILGHISSRNFNQGVYEEMPLEFREKSRLAFGGEVVEVNA